MGRRWPFKPIIKTAGPPPAVGRIVRAHGGNASRQAALAYRGPIFKPILKANGPPPAVAKIVRAHGGNASRLAGLAYRGPIFKPTIKHGGPPPAIGRQTFTGSFVPQHSSAFFRRPTYQPTIKTFEQYAAPVLAPVKIGRRFVSFGGMVSRQAAIPPLLPRIEIKQQQNLGVQPVTLVARVQRPKGDQASIQSALRYRRLYFQPMILTVGPPGVSPAAPAVPRGYPTVPRVPRAKDARMSHHTEMVAAILNSLLSKGRIQQTGITSYDLKGGVLVETAAPTFTDDRAHGFSTGDLWLDTSADQLYICVSDTTGSAAWDVVGSGGGSGATGTFSSGSFS